MKLKHNRQDFAENEAETEDIRAAMIAKVDELVDGLDEAGTEEFCDRLEAFLEEFRAQKR